MANRMSLVVYVSTGALLLLVFAVFAVLLILQRRRRRAQMLLVLAAEESERRRKKKKRTGLRSAEIDTVCPELIVVPTGTLSAEKSGAGDKRRDSLDNDHDHEDDAFENAAESAKGNISSPTVINDKAGSDEQHNEKGDLEDVPTRHSADSNSEERTPDPIEIEEGDETCVVCLEEMEVSQRVRRLPCGHVYHSPCIRVWLRRKNACPCCCKTVLKRKRKKKKPLVPLEPPPLPEMPVEPPRAASFSVRPSDRPTIQVFAHSQSVPNVETVNISSRSDSHHIIDINDLGRRVDRPRPLDRNSMQTLPSFPRNGSLLDPDDPTSEVLNSEASSHFDEQMAGALLEHVRQVLREPGNYDEYSTDGELSDACLRVFEDDDDSLLSDGPMLARNNPSAQSAFSSQSLQGLRSPPPLHISPRRQTPLVHRAPLMHRERSTGLQRTRGTL